MAGRRVVGQFEKLKSLTFFSPAVTLVLKKSDEDKRKPIIAKFW
jgi:hypothetical protein